MNFRLQSKYVSDMIVTPRDVKCFRRVWRASCLQSSPPPPPEQRRSYSGEGEIGFCDISDISDILFQQECFDHHAKWSFISGRESGRPQVAVGEP